MKEFSGILPKAKVLRKNMTEAEQRLWYLLRGHRFQRVKFKRQKPIGPYIVDFIAIRTKLIIELDGSQHVANKAYDAERTRYLEALGFTVLRFWNNEFLTNTEMALAKITTFLK